MQQKSRFRTPSMFKKRFPALRKAWDLLAFSIPSGKRLYLPTKPNLLLLKRMRRRSTRKLLGSGNYPFIGEYQFSPPSTPLFYHNWGRSKKGSKLGVSSALLLCLCSNTGAMEEEGFVYDTPYCKSETRAIEDDPVEEVELFVSRDENDSVDQRAEKFIARFYEDMKIQRQESALQYLQMMNRGCS